MANPLQLLLAASAARGASALHLAPGEMPWLRVDGEMVPLELQTGVLMPEHVEAIIRSALPDLRRSTGSANGESGMRFTFDAPDGARYRLVATPTRTGPSAVIRRVAPKPHGPGHRGLPEAVIALADQPSGLVLVTSAAGHGRSSTLSALVDHVNRTRASHILTIDEPIEFVQESQRCRVTQREVGTHVDSWSEALAGATRLDVDVLGLGDASDPATLRRGAQIAADGCLVLAAMEARSVALALSRLAAPDTGGEGTRPCSAVVRSLRGIVGQRLVPTVDGRRVAAFEVRSGTAGHQNRSDSAVCVERRVAGTAWGAEDLTVEQSLAELVLSGEVALTSALAAADDSARLERHLAAAAEGAYA